MAQLLPEGVINALREKLGGEPTRILPVGGGMINPAARVEVKGTRYFVKWRANAPRAMFELEARGLALLREHSSFRIPQVIAYAEGKASANAPAYLILKWLDTLEGVNYRRYVDRFGAALAGLHRVSAPQFGLDHDNYIGSLPQYNPLTSSWGVFYRDHRIEPQLEIARERGYLPPYRELLLRGVMELIEELLDTGNPPSLLHGDLWSGNYFPTYDDQPVLVDPAAYYGDREVEIAFTELFGGSPEFLRAYRDAFPLDAGYEYRRPLLQLCPLLVHLNHFGEVYGGGVDEICRIYLR